MKTPEKKDDGTITLESLAEQDLGFPIAHSIDSIQEMIEQAENRRIESWVRLTKENIASIIAILLVGNIAILALLSALAPFFLPPERSSLVADVVLRLITAIAGMAGMAIAYYFATSQETQGD